MSCTTILVGKNATHDRSTMISRTDDGHFDVKKMIVVEPKKQPRKYKSVVSHVEINLPDNPMRYTACPDVNGTKGLWAATGINAANVGMTATETITSNPRVLAADPLMQYVKAKKRGEKDIPGGIGEEDIVGLVLPYINTAREGVLRLAGLLERYGTYESNGIAFNDADEVWWMETIGGHHWMAKRVPDDVCVINPNQFGMDSFDLDDAFDEQKNHLCSGDLREFIEENRLDLNQNGRFNPRNIFGSHSDADHIYNTPRAWMLGRYLTPRTHRWDGDNAEFTPLSDDIPWSFVPERKLTPEDVKYMLSMHYQGTVYNPYSSYDSGRRGMYRSVGINRTGVTTICQIRDDVPDSIRGVEWVCFGSTTFSAMLPIYTNVHRLPGYLSKVAKDVSTDNLFWSSRLIGAMADHDYPTCVQHIERYQNAVVTEGRRIVLEYDRKVAEASSSSTDGKAAVQSAENANTAQYRRAIEQLLEEANEKLCAMAKEQTTDVLGKVLRESSLSMKNGFKMSDN